MPDTTPPAKIRLAGVTKRFGDKVVLDGLDFEIPEGDTVVVLGGSGSGKSVLLKHMIGLLSPDSGSIVVDGKRITVRVDGEVIDTGLRKFGAVLGDRSETGCNSVTNPGTLLGRGSHLLPCHTARGYHPPGSRIPERTRP